jgi:hypothetical protein
MINEIRLFMFVLSIVFILRFLFQFFYELTRENPEQLKLKETEKTFIYFAVSYIITYIII